MWTRRLDPHPDHKYKYKYKTEETVRNFNFNFKGILSIKLVDGKGLFRRCSCPCKESISGIGRTYRTQGYAGWSALAFVSVNDKPIEDG